MPPKDVLSKKTKENFKPTYTVVAPAVLKLGDKASLLKPKKDKK